MSAIRYTLSRNEVVYSALCRWYRRRETIMLLLMLVFFAAAYYFMGFGPSWVALIPLAVLLLLPISRIYWILRLLNSSPALLSETTLDFDDECLTLMSDLGTSRTLWRAFTKAVNRPKYFELYVSELHAIIIPKRAFSISDMERFEAIIKQLPNHS
jgi:hypothetical protein